MQCPWCGVDTRPTFGRCLSLDGTAVFDVDDYDAAIGGSVVVTDPADADRPLATSGSDSRLHLRESGGDVVAVVERRRMELPDCWVDDRWELNVTRELPTLDRRALVAVLLVCRALFSLGPFHHP